MAGTNLLHFFDQRPVHLESDALVVLCKADPSLSSQCAMLIKEYRRVPNESEK